jgi:diguanylate cyclase (GGDEF)-like protein
VAGKRLAVCDPSGRLLAELAPVARDAGLTLHALKAGQYLDGVSALLIAPLVAVDLGPAPEAGPARWVVGNIENAARLAGAASQAGAAGVLLTPVTPSTLTAIARDGSGDAEQDLGRARKLIAASLVELTGAASETLAAIADGFGAQDCIVWWRDASHQMTPTSAREPPDAEYRTLIANAARMAAAAQGTVIAPGAAARSVIADTLRSSPTEVAGMVALVADNCRPFSTGERNDMRAIAARLTRELGWLQSHRRLVAEGERLLAASLHDPLTGAMTRGAFEQTVAHEVTGASRRKERLTLAVIDIVGLRRINLQYGHRAGDEVIAQLASRVRAVVRGNDPIGRLGADEIAVLLVGAEAEQAVQVVRKLIYKIQSEPIQADEALLAVSVRAVASEIGPGERSGEAALGRCYGALRTAPHGDVKVVAVDSRVGDDPSAYVGALSAGTVVGGTYRVVHELSRGAMGVVYRGEDLGLGRAVAIKVLRSDLASDRELVGKFRAEAAILASLHHPNLVQVYALGEHAGEVYFVMELVEGEPLSEVLRATFERKEWLHPAAVAHIALEIGDALDAMHARGVIHRDVKPANILLDRVRDRAVLVDVGVAVKGGERRDAAGTPGFAAPESFMGLAETPATDVYGLGATVYCMIAGRPPFGSGGAQHVLRRQMQEEMPKLAPVREHLSSAVDTVLAKALSPDPNKRWASASTFAFALGRALQRMPTRERMAVRLPTDPVFEELILPAAEIEPVDTKPKSGVRAVLGQVRAAHLRVLSRIVQAQVGDSGLARLVADAPQLAYVFASTLAPLEWVALGDLVGALERARQWVPGQHVPRKVGRGTMTATFARMFGAEPSSLTPETVLGALPTFWPRYHDWGSIAASVQTGTAGISLEGFAGSTDVCALVGAQLERIVEMTGATGVTAAHNACTFVGASRCEYRLTWTPVPEPR